MSKFKKSDLVYYGPDFLITGEYIVAKILSLSKDGQIATVKRVKNGKKETVWVENLETYIPKVNKNKLWNKLWKEKTHLPTIMPPKISTK